MIRTMLIIMITFTLIGTMLSGCGDNDAKHENTQNPSQSETPSQGNESASAPDDPDTDAAAADSQSDTLIEERRDGQNQSSEVQQDDKTAPSERSFDGRGPTGPQEGSVPSERQPDGLSPSGQEGLSQSGRQPGDLSPSKQEDGNTNPSAKYESGDWMLLLVNTENPMPDGYTPALKALENGLKFDERAIDQLNAMLSEAKNQGLSPVVCSAYRTVEYQRTLFNNNVSKLVASGLSKAQAEKETARGIAYPGTSEHGIGLAADIVSNDYQQLTEKQADTPEVTWLLEHCSDYGFILRYPKDKEDITGIKYEPWHFRYVGVQAAREIMENGLCLEEYLAL